MPQIRPNSGTLALRRAIAATRGEKVSRTVARMVAKNIADGKISPGSSLPSEQEMAQRFGVGRASVREGLRLLEAQGLVTVRQGLGGGPIVAEPSGIEFGETLSMYLQVNDIRFSEVVEAAIEMEGLSAAMVADKVASGEITDISLLTGDGSMVEQQSNEDVIEFGVGFHDCMRHLAGNYILELTGSSLAHIFGDRALGAHADDWTERERKTFEHKHSEIVAAISAGNATEARRLAREHMKEVAEIATSNNPSILQDRVEWK